MLIHIENLQAPHLDIQCWLIASKSTPCVVGLNGAGKQYLQRLLCGDLQPHSYEVWTQPDSEKVALVSFETQQAVFEHELKIDETDIYDKIDDGTQAQAFLPRALLDHSLIDDFGMRPKLATGYRLLSTGESRKLLILKAILEGVEGKGLDLLILENPFDSLDVASCAELNRALEKLSELDITLLLFLNNRCDIPSWANDISVLEQGKLLQLGDPSKAEVSRQLDVIMTVATPDIEWPETQAQQKLVELKYLVALNKGKVSFNGSVIFEGLDFYIKPLQHTLVTGPNGCGKSTLLNLVTGDHPQCYGNDLAVLGFTRGQGESIWQLKKYMGIVSSELHRNYRVRCSVLVAVVSGFYDSIGLYQKPEPFMVESAKQWLQCIGLAEHLNTEFQQLSYGEQRLVLIVRALVKSPYLLILDEPTQGLDEVNRRIILSFMDTLASLKHSTILFVSHRQDEFLPLFEQHIEL